MQNCFEKGLLLLSCGESTLRFCPPLIVTPEEDVIAVEIFDAVIGEAELALLPAFGFHCSLFFSSSTSWASS